MKAQHAPGVRLSSTPHNTAAEAAFDGLIFVHVPKTAGTTILRILERQYGRDAVVGLYDSFSGDEVAALPPHQITQMRVIAGHFYFGVHEHLPGTWRYLTFLRDPVERVVSHYDFVRGQPDHYLHRAATTMPLSAFVEFCDGAEPNNDQTRLLAGSAMGSRDGIWAPAMLPVAKRHLDRHVVTGLAEAFDASLVLMRRIFGWRSPFYISQNVGGSRGRVAASTTDRDVIRRYNALDVELYRYARQRFEEEVAAQGDAFARELRAFRRRNAVYRKVEAVQARVPWRLRRT